MPEKKLEFGSKEWLEWVFSSPPVDKIKGRTKWTQAHAPWSPVLKRAAPVQGRGEYIGFLVLLYLHRLGLIKRMKEHAFATGTDDLGWEIRPDHFAESKFGGLHVIENKTARFVTVPIQMELDANRTGLKRFGLNYLVWTDKHPLSRPVRHNLIEMRRASTEDVSDEEIDRLAELVRIEGEIPLSAVLLRGFDLVDVFAAWWNGQIFLPLTQDVGQTTLVRNFSIENYEAIFLNEKPLTDEWWETLHKG